MTLLCERAMSVDLVGGTNAAVWLSSLPFIDEERRSGAAAACELFRTAMRGEVSTEEWQKRIAEPCDRLALLLKLP